MTTQLQHHAPCGEQLASRRTRIVKRGRFVREIESVRSARSPRTGSRALQNSFNGLELNMNRRHRTPVVHRLARGAFRPVHSALLSAGTLLSYVSFPAAAFEADAIRVNTPQTARDRAVSGNTRKSAQILARKSVGATVAPRNAKPDASPPLVVGERSPLLHVQPLPNGFACRYECKSPSRRFVTFPATLSAGRSTSRP